MTHVASRAGSLLRATPVSLRLQDQMARDLGILIVSGHYKPGDLLEAELVGTKRLGVSRTAYREALQALAAKGLIKARPKIGTRVLPMHNWHLLDPDVLSWMFQGEPDEHLVKSLFQLRNVVEPTAAELAAERRSSEELLRMEGFLNEMAQHSLTTHAGRLADQQFHSAVLEASGNPFLANMAGGIAAAVEWSTIFKQRHGPLTRDTLHEHRRIFDAIAARDGSEARVATAYLVNLALTDATTALRKKADTMSGRRVHQGEIRP